MPAHILPIDEHGSQPYPSQLAAEIERIEAREDIVSIVQTGGAWVIATRKRPGRPRSTEKRVTSPQETR